MEFIIGETNIIFQVNYKFQWSLHMINLTKTAA